MKPLPSKPMLAFAALAVVSLGLAACTLAVAPSPTPFVLPTPNLVLTALALIQQTPTAAPASTAVPTSTAVPVTATSVYCTGTNLANFVSESIPDGTSISPGSPFVKTWTLTNVGTCTWNTNYSVVFVSGSQMGGPSSIPLPTAVPPGSSVTLSMNLVAPATPGSYTGYYQLSTDQGVRFGVGAGGASNFWVRIWSGTPQPVPPPFPVCHVPYPPQRPSVNGGVVEAFYNSGGAPSFSGDTYTDTFWTIPLPNSANNLVFKSSNYSEPNGYNVSYELRWDTSNLYVGVIVLDPNAYVQTSTGSSLYEGDSVEILLDTNLSQDYCDRFLSPYDYQLGLSDGAAPAAPPAGEAYLWYPKSQTGSRPTVSVGGLVSSVTPPGNGWMLEATIPWSVFGVYPTSGQIFGFALGISADEVASTAQQQALWSSDPYRLLTNPMTWGTLELSPNTAP